MPQGPEDIITQCIVRMSNRQNKERVKGAVILQFYFEDMKSRWQDAKRKFDESLNVDIANYRIGIFSISVIVFSAFTF